MTAIETAINEYIEEYGVRPEPAILSRLADEILREELTDSNPHKVMHNEYPIMSDRQLARRREGKYVRRTDKSGNKQPFQREVPLNLALSNGIDGKCYRFPSRRLLSVDEMIEKERSLEGEKKGVN